MHGENRRRFLQLTGMASAALALPSRADAIGDMSGHADSPSTATLFLCGDVMLGRGIDQVLPHPGDPDLHEPYVRSATTYVELAEKAHGPIPRAVDYAYVWGDALDTLRRLEPAARIINLETSVTESEDLLPKGINYRMSPANARVLAAAHVDCCVLANNHVLDWGLTGLLDTLETLERLGIRTAGAGRDAASAAAPAILHARGGARVLVFGFGAVSSGIPPAWAAERNKPGVDLLQNLSDATVEAIATRVQAARHPGDILIASVHWGGNWGYEVSREQTAFARGLIGQAGFDVVHGHSSHHAKAIEIYQGRPILYGCGDFLNDYEGITGYEEFRDDLAVMYLPAFAATSGNLVELPLEIFQIRKFRLHRASVEDTRWLQAVLDRESRRFGTRVEWADANQVAVRW
jgi:poly-gamma-glutamate capsule biosynthesis protein CapA/YwtB (metallophosphatase superfamily)